jgi:hypothetical protein
VTTRKWEYETDQSPKRKHHWKNDYADHVLVGGILVSKCPSSLTHEKATEMLNSGYEHYGPGRRRGYPLRIFAVLDGVVYRATPTIPGRSYHGFPELRENLPGGRELREAIIELARQDGSEDMVRKWLR